MNTHTHTPSKKAHEAYKAMMGPLGSGWEGSSAEPRKVSELKATGTWSEGGRDVNKRREARVWEASACMSCGKDRPTVVPSGSVEGGVLNQAPGVVVRAEKRGPTAGHPDKQD